MSLSEDIKALAYEAGFHAVGITSAEPFVEAGHALGGRRMLPTARSVISVALSYISDESDLSDQSDTPHLRGRMARFSRGLDYHRVVQERLSMLADGIRARAGRVEIRPFCDTGPLSDRAAAIRAGIGSQGKNACVYAGDYGSWVVLGELLTDIELEPFDQAQGRPDICGECDICMKACPTGAISAPYIVDAKICLSHATQMKGFIPHWLRERMGVRIYGCDTCQEVCPLNKKAKPGNVEEFHPSHGLGENPELLPLLSMTQEEFDARIAPTTAGWIGRTSFRRNVTVALGNIGDPAAVPGLVKALSDREPVIRGHAAWALGKVGIPQARLALEEALARETDEQTAGEIEGSMVKG